MKFQPVLLLVSLLQINIKVNGLNLESQAEAVRLVESQHKNSNVVNYFGSSFIIKKIGANFQ